MRPASAAGCSRASERTIAVGVRGRSAGLAAKLARKAIAAYRRFVSPALPPSCRFHPTCSAYADQAIEHYGLLRGLGLTIVRLAKCHPLHPGGFDPLR